jgi:hypothetical protein
MKLNADPTDQYKKIKQLLRTQNIIPNEHKWKYSNMNPTAPNLDATIKQHKIHLLDR